MLFPQCFHPAYMAVTTIAFISLSTRESVLL